MVELAQLETENHFLKRELSDANLKLELLKHEMTKIRNTKKTTLIEANRQQAETIKDLSKQLRELNEKMNTWNIMAK